MENEVWKDVVGYEGLYKVSNLGEIESLPKKWVGNNGCLRSHNGKRLKLIKNSKGYNVVNLCVNSLRKSKKVHQLVAMAFLNYKNNDRKIVIDHVNDNKSDNRLENLQIVTQRFNTCKTQGQYSSQYKGVYFNKKANKWHSRIEINGKINHLGFFTDEFEAHNAYQNKLHDLI